MKLPLVILSMAAAWAACGEEALVKGFNGALSPDGTSRDVLARGRWRDYSPGICDALVTGRLHALGEIH